MSELPHGRYGRLKDSDGLCPYEDKIGPKLVTQILPDLIRHSP